MNVYLSIASIVDDESFYVKHNSWLFSVILLDQSEGSYYLMIKSVDFIAFLIIFMIRIPTYLAVKGPILLISVLD